MIHERQHKNKRKLDLTVLLNTANTGCMVQSLFLLVVGACNFGVENDSFPAYNGEQYSPDNLNQGVVIMKILHIKPFEETYRKHWVRQNIIDLKILSLK